MTGSKFGYISTVLCVVLAAFLISDVTAKSYKSSKHTYPTSHGHSGSHSDTHNTHQASHTYPSHSSSPGSGYGGGITQHKNPSSHTYPTINSLSGTGSKPSGSVWYPPSPGLSGGSHNPSGGSSYGSGSKPGPVSYPASPGLSGGSHYPSGGSSYGSGSKPGPVSYPASPGLSGGSHYPSGGTSYGSGSKPGPVSYPASPGLSGGSHYPSGGLNYGTGGNSYPHHTITNWGREPKIHHHHTHHHYYNYKPPPVIYYHTSHGPVSYPVYTGSLPSYVYEYRSSGNKYRYLLAGLALYNLGRMSSDMRMRDYHTHYSQKPDEHCMFGVRYSSGQYEEMAVDCRSITYFIYEMQTQPQTAHEQVSTNVITTNVVTSVVQQNQTTGPVQQQVNGVVVPNTQQILSSNGTVLSNQQVNTVTTTTTTVTSVKDPRFSGNPVQLESSMQCYVTRRTAFSNVNKPVPCDLLQSYSKQSFYRSHSEIQFKSSLTLLITAVAFVIYSV